jgi:hypothetical protein
MNNKIIDYEEAVKQLNLLSAVQGFMKQLKCITVEDQRVTRENIRVRRKEINLLLSIIASEKKARKLYGRLISISGVSSTKRGPK